MKRNIELKARFHDLGRGHRIARAIGALLHSVERHRDTYFRVTRGRLKLRERWQVASLPEAAVAAPPTFGDPAPSQLIWYDRTDEARPRASDYSLVVVPHGEPIRKLLSNGLGVIGEVVKVRTVYLHDNVRIHLDEVEGLGTFLEFEAIVGPECDDAAARDKLDRLQGVFHIDQGQVLSQSYCDLTRTCDGE